jgi:hypothetical protein
LSIFTATHDLKSFSYTFCGGVARLSPQYFFSNNQFPALRHRAPRALRHFLMTQSLDQVCQSSTKSQNIQIKKDGNNIRARIKTNGAKDFNAGKPDIGDIIRFRRAI